MSDNVIPSMLVYFGVINLEDSNIFNLRTAFPKADTAKLLAQVPTDAPAIKLEDLRDGPSLVDEEAYVLRAAAVDACERMAVLSRDLQVDTSLSWLHQIRPSQLDMWLWSVAKDRADYRILPRFAEQNTVFY